MKQSVFIPVREKKQFNRNSLSLANVQLEYVKYPKFIGKFSFFLKQIMFWRMFWENFGGKLNCDFIHAHTLYSDGFLAYFLNRKNNIPYAVTVRTTDLNVFERILFHWRWLTIKVLRNAKRVIFLSESQKKLLIDKYGESVNRPVVIHNGVDSFWVQNSLLKKKRLKNREIKTALYIGEVSRNKNIKSAILTFFSTVRNEATQFIVIGGSYADYERVYGALPVDLVSKVNFLGKVNDKQLLRKYLEESHILIMVSHMETFGLVYLEAISQCTPVVYSQDQGFDGVFPEGKVGYACDSKNLNSISAAIEKTFSAFPDGLDFTEKGKNPVSNFSWENIATIYLNEVYR